MRMNRRNVLFVLGTTILLGGALIASGAFSQVEATRDVTVETTGDEGAALGLQVSDEYSNVSNIGDSSGAVEIEFSNLNKNATFRFDDVLTITNNGGQPVDINISTSSGVTVYNETGETDTTGLDLGTFQDGDSESVGFAINTTEINSGESAEITIHAES